MEKQNIADELQSNSDPLPGRVIDQLEKSCVCLRVCVCVCVCLNTKLKFKKFSWMKVSSDFRQNSYLNNGWKMDLNIIFLIDLGGDYVEEQCDHHVVLTW